MELFLCHIGGLEPGKVTKKWAGIGKGLFISPENYMISISDGVDPEAMEPLLVGEAICIDMALKEKPG